MWIPTRPGRSPRAARKSSRPTSTTPPASNARSQGAHGAYCVTNFWEHFSPEKEYAQARNLAQAAKASGIRHAIWSTLEDTRQRVPLSRRPHAHADGQYKVPHFDAKGEADRCFREAGVPTTFLRTSFYWDNLIHFGMGPKPGPDGMLAFTLPMGDAKLPGMAAEDIGRCAYGIFKRGDEFIGKTCRHRRRAPDRRADGGGAERALGRAVRYNAVTPATYRRFGFPGADDLGNMFQYKRDFEGEFCGARDLALSRDLNPRCSPSRSGWRPTPGGFRWTAERARGQRRARRVDSLRGPARPSSRGCRPS